MQNILKNNMIELILNKINKNILDGKYEPLSKTESVLARRYYASNLKIALVGDSVTEFHTKSNTLIGKGYERVVIGDYGAYVEFNESQINKKNIIIKPSQGFRLSPSFIDKVKYIWYESDDDSKVKVYHQKKTVKYADYKIGYYYISPNDLEIDCNLFI